MSHVICDVREYDAFDPRNLWKYGASEPLCARIAHLLKDAGHQVDGIWKGQAEVLVDGIRWYPWNRHPLVCDVLVSFEWLIYAHQFDFKRLIVPLNKINPILSGLEDKVAAFVVFSQEHKRQLLVINPTIRPEQVAIIPVGVDMPTQMAPKITNRLLYSNTPERGLVHIARMWPRLVEKVPDVSIAITYGVQRSWEQNKWRMDNMTEELLEVRRWIEQYPGSVLDMGRINPREALLKVLAESALYVYPADAALPGIVACLSAMEAAAAGCGLVLSDLEGLPEIFKDCAEFLPIPIHDWADLIEAILKDPLRMQVMQRKARRWAKTVPWSKYAAAWRKLVVTERVECKQPSPA